MVAVVIVVVRDVIHLLQFAIDFGIGRLLAAARLLLLLTCRTQYPSFYLMNTVFRIIQPSLVLKDLTAYFVGKVRRRNSDSRHDRPSGISAKT